MKKVYMFIAVLMAMISPAIAQVAINADGLVPVASAMLDVSSITKGMLVPRMTTSQRNAVVLPATGLLVYDISYQSFWFYNSVAWQQIANGGTTTLSAIQDADGNTKVQTEKNTNENMIRFTINGTERMRLESKYLHTTFPLYGLSIGDSAGAVNISGDDNTFIGYHAGRYNTSGDWNTFIGKAAGQANNSGDYNTFTGRSSGAANTIGSSNSFYGVKSGLNNSEGSFNTFYGHYSGVENTTGSYNSFLGSQAGYSNTTGSYNSFIGRAAGILNTSGGHNIAIGTAALGTNTTAGSLIAIGDSALYNNHVGAIFSGVYNTGVGTKALFNNINGRGNTAIGYQTLMDGGTSYYNRTAVGYNVGTSVHTGGNAGYNTKSYCTMIGSELEANGANTVMIGYNIKPLWYCIPTKNSVRIPVDNPSVCDTGWYETTNSIGIGNNLKLAAGEIVLGSSDQTSFYCEAALSIVDNFLGTPANLYITSYGNIGVLVSPTKDNADIGDIGNVDWLYKLRPVNFTLNSDENKTKQFGLVADEAAQVAPELVSYNKDKQPESVSYSLLVPPLLKAVQEQKKIIEQLLKEVEELKNR